MFPYIPILISMFETRINDGLESYIVSIIFLEPQKNILRVDIMMIGTIKVFIE